MSQVNGALGSAPTPTNSDHKRIRQLELAVQDLQAKLRQTTIHAQPIESPLVRLAETVDDGSYPALSGQGSNIKVPLRFLDAKFTAANGWEDPTIQGRGDVEEDAQVFAANIGTGYVSPATMVLAMWQRAVRGVATSSTDGEWWFVDPMAGREIFVGQPTALHPTGQFASYNIYHLTGTGPAATGTSLSNVYQESGFSYSAGKWHYILETLSSDSTPRYWSFPVQFIDCTLTLPETELTLDSNTNGQIAIDSGSIVRHRVDTFDNQSTGDLSTIIGGVTGQITILRAQNASRTVVVKDNVDNIRLNADFSLDGTQDVLMLYTTSAGNHLQMSVANNN